MPTSIYDTITGDGLKTSILGDRVKKCQQACMLGKALDNKTLVGYVHDNMHVW
jgi:hypothetical protein